MNVEGDFPMIHTPILQTKLIPPIPTSTYMRRSSFIKKMKTSERVKLTLLHSGAGYGKSSSLASYFNDTRSIHSWYSVTEEDDDILPFMTYLKSSIQRIIPNFGLTFEDWMSTSMFPQEEDLNRWHALFINELCEIGEPISIVIDDFHLVDHVFFINYMMEKIIEFLPPHVHLIVATRTRPRWTNLIKLKLTAQLCEIEEHDFIFSEEEIAVFYEDYFNTILSATEAENIVRMTEGWAIAINLMAMHMTESAVPFDTAMKPALHDLFSYLSEEVFTNMSVDEREWLLSFAIFPVFSVQLATEFYGEEAAAKLREFVGQHVFIQPLSDEGTYRYHALFQQFLESKWERNNLTRYKSLQKKAADYYIEKNNPIQAVFHAIKSKDSLFIGAMVANVGAVLVKSGQFDWLLDTIQDLSDEVRDTYYPLHFFEGEAHRYKAFYEKSSRAYAKCLEVAKNYNDTFYASKANAGIAHVYLDTIQPGMAEPYLLAAISYAQKSTKMTFHEMKMLKRQFAENLVNLGKAEEAGIWVVKEKIDKGILREGNLDARISLRTGNLKEALVILSERTLESRSLPDSHRETDVLLSLIYSFTGQVALAMDNAEKGIELGERAKMGFVEAVGWIRMGHAKVLQDPYELEIPEQYYLQAIKRMGDLRVSRGKAEPLMGYSILQARRGLFRDAISLGEEGLRETEKVNDGWLSGLIRMGLAIVHFYAGNYENAEKNSDEAEKLFKVCGDKYGEFVSSFWLMNIFDKTKQTVPFIEQVKDFSELCIRHDFNFFLSTKTLFSPFDMESIYPLFIKAGPLINGHTETKQIIEQLSLTDVTTHPGYKILVQLMGPFKLSLGLDEIDEKNWQREKAKELFVYLLLNRTRYIPKEEIIRELWGEADEKSANRDFKVALNALLKVIEPHRSPREQSFFILRQQTMYRLNPIANISTDLDRFYHYANKGLSERSPTVIIEVLLKTVSLHKGLLFEEKLEVEWISDNRERIEQQYILVIERLAQTYTRIQEFGKTVYWAEKLLRIDNTWEEAYRLLMFAHYQLQNRTQSVKWYNRCITILNEELNIGPMETTERMYKIIMNEL